jgi:glycosyltransferase involved in cell wall biosynthesis
LAKVIRDEKPDVVNGQGWIIYSALAALGRAGPPMVVTLHDYGLMCAKRTFMHGDQTCNGPELGKCVRCAGQEMGAGKALGVAGGLRASRGLHARVDRFIAVSQAVADASAPYLLGTADRTHVLPSFVSDSVMKEAPNAPRPAFVPARGEYVLFVGGLARSKGVDVLLAAHERMSPRPHLVIIATPPVGPDVEMPDDVTLVAGVEHADVMGAWAHCALGVVPSRWPEPFGQVAVEAMVCGKAVVASNIGGLADIIRHGETGLLVTPGDAEELRGAIEQLLGDRARSERMGAAGRSRAETFVASRVTEDVEAVFADVVHSRRPSATPEPQSRS